MEGEGKGEEGEGEGEGWGVCLWLWNRFMAGEQCDDTYTMALYCKLASYQAPPLRGREGLVFIVPWGWGLGTRLTSNNVMIQSYNIQGLYTNLSTSVFPADITISLILI